MTRQFRPVSAVGLVAGLASLAACSRPLSVIAVAGATIARPSIVDDHGPLPVQVGRGGLGGIHGSIEVSPSWTLHTEALVVHDRFASSELPTDTPVRLTSMAVPVMIGVAPHRDGRLELRAGWRGVWPIRARRALRNEDQDVLADYRGGGAIVLGATTWLDTGHHLSAELRYVAGVTNLDATGWFTLKPRSLEITVDYRLWRHAPRTP